MENTLARVTGAAALSWLTAQTQGSYLLQPKPSSATRSNRETLGMLLACKVG